MVEHGGNIFEISRTLNIPPEEILDFSANINPFACSGDLKEHLFSRWDHVKVYPDRNYPALKEAIAGSLHIPGEWILPGNGAIELIRLFIETSPYRKGLILGPAFMEYEGAFKRAEKEFSYFPYTFDPPGINVERLKRELLRGYDLLVICNPNNPTGFFLDFQILEEILSFAASNSAALLVDESFIEFISAKESVISLTGRFPGLFTVRSMTKFFAIPGLRLGYLVSSDLKALDNLKERQIPWSINCFAMEAGLWCLNNSNPYEAGIRKIRDQRAFLIAELKKLKWLKIYRSEANFILLKLADKFTAAEVRKLLLKKKILIRTCESFTLLDDTFIRIAVKDHHANVRLIEALKGL